MATDESARLHLFEHARDSWGGRAAPTLMSVLPDTDRFATKDDLAVLEARLDAKIERTKSEILRSLQFTILASNVTLVSLVFAATQLD